ncbi:MAG: citrate/2-methylcitrate synthase, partial [bacterium]|nr:citrate/2-methylcitrate synthase [bacterium]
MAKTARLIIDDKQLDLPIIEGSEGELGIDISQLRAQTGYIALDPSFGNTGSCKSAVTFIDGEKGILRYRGIPIEQFDREDPNFIEVCWLLIFGRLPKKDELARFSNLLTGNAHL